MAQSNLIQPMNQSINVLVSHSSSLSQPIFFENKCYPPLNRFLPSESSMASSNPNLEFPMEEIDVSSFTRENLLFGSNGSLPPRRAHHRSSSDIPLGFSEMIQSSPQLVPISSRGNDKKQELDMVNCFKSDVKLEGEVDLQNSFNSVSDKSAQLNLDFGYCGFNEVELKKIVGDARLAEIAKSEPKRAKWILANRQSAARSKERKLRYISELEHKVQTLQIEAITLSGQVINLQKDCVELTNQNNELKFRFQVMEQQSQLRDALHETLMAEVERLKFSDMEITREDGVSN